MATTKTATLSFEEIILLAQEAGVPDSELVTCAAIAAAASSRRPEALGVNTDGSLDMGLWQINDKAHPDVSEACAFDPQCAAGAMYRISTRGTNWTPWSAYKNGSYRKFLGEALKARQNVRLDQGYSASDLIILLPVKPL
jgi:hypothetical protein